jgi:GT2 family glycosyltransferase
MNVDAVLHPSFIREALALLRVHPDVGVIAPEVYKLYPDDEWRFWRGQQLVSDRRPTTSRATHLQSEGGVVRLTPMMRVDVPEDQPDAWRPSFKANGACPIIRRALLEQMQQRFGVAPFDPTFDTYGEDVDFAFKAWALRWRTMFARQVQAGHIRSYASPVALVDKRGRLRINLVAERYINALRHLPPDRLIPVTLRALREDAEMAIRQARRGDHEARKDVAAGLARAWRMWPDLLRFRVLHRTWQRIDFLTEVHCERPTIDDRRLATNDRPEAVDLFHTRQSRL